MQVILALVIDCKMEKHVGHSFLIYFLEILESQRQNLVV